MTALLNPMDPRSELCLVKVEPRLVAVMRATAQLPQPFEVIYGLRTREAEAQAVLTHHSTTMHSRHLPDATNGLAAAIDFAPLVDGKVSFCEGHEEEFYGRVFVQIAKAAADLYVPIEWGGQWKTFKDWGHIQLPWKDTP